MRRQERRERMPCESIEFPKGSKILEICSVYKNYWILKLMLYFKCLIFRLWIKPWPSIEKSLVSQRTFGDLEAFLTCQYLSRGKVVDNEQKLEVLLSILWSREPPHNRYYPAQWFLSSWDSEPRNEAMDFQRMCWAAGFPTPKLSFLPVVGIALSTQKHGSLGIHLLS